MKLFYVGCILLAPFIAQTQEKNKYAQDAFLILRMVAKHHIAPKQVDEKFGTAFFESFLQQIDHQKIFFTQAEVNALAPFKKTIHTELLTQKNSFLTTVTALLERNIKLVDSFATVIAQKPYSFLQDDYYTVAEDTVWALDRNVQLKKIDKLIKKGVIDYILTETDVKSSMTPIQLKKITDSIEPIARKKIVASLKRNIVYLQLGAIGIREFVGIQYCETLASCFDPHSTYMPRTQKENFQSHLGQKAFKFGFSLEKDEESNNIEIRDLQPGSSAFKSGQLNKGDKIVAIQWEGKEQIDIKEAELTELSRLLNESNHDKLTITIKKADGTIKKVDLYKEQIDSDEDDSRVKGIIFTHGENRVGYIALPSFYTDWENMQNNINGCANDIAREIIQLKKENINGLIVDLRYNGGGSLLESVELAGLFIDAGPVSLLQRINEKLATIKDVNRGTVYDGPLAIMVNGSSASASELFAAAMQDYHRAVIIGSTTYGKATGQIILPLDTLVSPKNYTETNKYDSYLKITVDKLYRISGYTAQATGVVPDIFIPSVTLAEVGREALQVFALPATQVEGNKFYTAYPIQNIMPFIQKGRAIIDSSSSIKKIMRNQSIIDSISKPTNSPLSLKKAIIEKEAYEKLFATASEENDQPILKIEIEQTSKEAKKQQSNSLLKNVNAQWGAYLVDDPWVQIAVAMFQSKNYFHKK